MLLDMQDINKNIKKLCEAIGVAGLENKASQKAAKLLKEYVDDVVIDNFGNVIGKIVSKNPNAKTVLLDAHIDEIGMIVTAIDDKGFLKVSNCGGIDRRLLCAQEVTVHCSGDDLLGIIGSKPPHLEKADEAKKIAAIDDVFVDIGFTKEEAEKKVNLGDRITINSTYNELLNNRISIKSLDDRSGVVSILEALKLLKGKDLDVNVVVLFSAQEEIGCMGAKIGVYGHTPDYAIVVDVSFAYTSDAEKHKCGVLGKGVMIGVSAFLDKKMSDDLIQTAKNNEIPYQIEVITGRSTGTNADAIITSKNGVRTAVLSIPLKYMHSPIEVIEIGDIEAVASLIHAYITKAGDLNV